MSSATQPTTPTTDDRGEAVVIISHSPLFYWWPVWAAGFLMAGLTYWYGYKVAFVPAGTVADRGARVEGVDGPRDILIAPKGETLPAVPESDDPKQPRLRMLPSNTPGVLWALILCLVIVSSQVPLRGVWSLIAIIVVVFTTIVFSLLGWWDPIIQSIKVVDIHITGFSYLSISTFLFVLWLLAFFMFDRMTYMVFTRGQLRVRMTISQGETVFDTRGMVVERHRDDLFRHWLLGFGSGDLTVRPAGTGGQVLQLPNVLGIGYKLNRIHRMLQEREVVRASR
jgi:hypothetical protein